MKNSWPIIQDVPARVNILGVGISITNLLGAISVIDNWIERGEKNYVCVRDVNGVIECQRDENLKNIHKNSGLTVPDGMPLVWICRLSGYKRISRVYGPDLMMEVFEMSLQKGYTHFLYGGNYGVAKTLRKKLENKLPGIRIVGTYTPPFRHLNRYEEKELRGQIERLKPDFFWVGLSTPKQERFMAQYINKLNTKVMIGVGAAFDIHAGLIKDAPDFLKRIGMQWCYRLFKEPKRLWRRYLLNNPRFLGLITLQLLKLKDFKR